MIELYINKQLCEIENPDNFSVYLKRTLLNPAELSTKDAQRSYDITLPATAVNNAIFGYTNTEEVKGKFAQLYDAELIVNGIKIFDGKFRMSEITKTSYKGNLGVPAQKSVKDIFGEMKMNEAGEWPIPFEKISDMDKYNKGEITEAKYCFFPLVLYGLLPKVEKTGGGYSPKDVFDDTVQLKLDHMPPSINCLETLRHIFESRELQIEGSAFEDERLTNLFMSYRNPIEYQMPWNYGELAKMSVKGSWTNAKSPSDKEIFYSTHQDNEDFYIVDLFNASNSNVRIVDDPGSHVSQYPIQTDKGNVKATFITIPYDGYYKIIFDAEVALDHTLNQKYTSTEPKVVSASYGMGSNITNLNFQDHRFEVKVLRRRNDEDISLDTIGFDNSFYRDNYRQDNDGDYIDAKFFPEIGGVNFVDMKQNPYLLCGLSFGQKNHNPHPLNNNLLCNPIAKKAGGSWDKNEFLDEEEFVVTNCPVFYKVQYDLETDGLSYEPESNYVVNLENAPKNYVERDNEGFTGKGKISQIVWLNKGEQLTVVSTADAGTHKFWTLEAKGWVKHHINFNLSVEAFRTDKDWLKLGDFYNNEKIVPDVMDWDDDKNFLTDKLNLAKFLPTEIKVNDWIDNFCKAFNLDLIQINSTLFELNTKQIKKFDTSSVVELDKRNNTDMSRVNNSLQLPSIYEIGFTVDKNEEGYVKSSNNMVGDGSRDDGGGFYETGSPENKTLNQTSFFSYNWLKIIYDTENTEWAIPVISDKEAWEKSASDYSTMQEKNYINKVQRFWYKRMDKTFPVILNKSENIETAMVTDLIEEKQKIMRLNYKNEPNSILNTYFTLLTDADNTYTVIECYLTPDEYNQLADSWVRFNGDLYYVAEIDGYDPLCKKKTSLKLIRKQ